MLAEGMGAHDPIAVKARAALRLVEVVVVQHLEGLVQLVPARVPSRGHHELRRKTNSCEEGRAQGECGRYSLASQGHAVFFVSR